MISLTFLVEHANNIVLATAVNGAVLGLNEDVYSARPLTTLKFEIAPEKDSEGSAGCEPILGEGSGPLALLVIPVEVTLKSPFIKR